MVNYFYIIQERLTLHNILWAVGVMAVLFIAYKICKPLLEAAKLKRQQKKEQEKQLAAEREAKRQEDIKKFPNGREALKEKYKNCTVELTNLFTVAKALGFEYNKGNSEGETSEDLGQTKRYIANNGLTFFAPVKTKCYSRIWSFDFRNETYFIPQIFGIGSVEPLQYHKTMFYIKITHDYQHLFRKSLTYIDSRERKNMEHFIDHLFDLKEYLINNKVALFPLLEEAYYKKFPKNEQKETTPQDTNK